MISLLQRVSTAEVAVQGDVIARIGPGLLVLVAVEPGDATATAERMLERLFNYRVFADAEGRMNRSLRDTGGGLLLVPQFTLAADTQRGNRPSFTAAADPLHARALFDALVRGARDIGIPVASGRFGADMQVRSTNEGPVTFWLEVPPPKHAAQGTANM